MKYNFKPLLLEDAIGFYMKKRKKGGKFVPIWRTYGDIPHIRRKKGQFMIMYTLLIFFIILLILWVFNPLLTNLIGDWVNNTGADPTGRFFIALIPIGLLFFFGIAGLIAIRSG